MKQPQFEARVVSGMRPTGRLHVGHYFGALQNYVRLQDEYKCFFMVADLHALTTGDLTKLELAQNTRDMVLDWLAVGIDPAKAVVFVQSGVPEHSELYLLLSMFTSLGWLERNPTYKEQREQLGEKATGSLGFLGYPVLQTVDVCMYKGTRVPVGEDQKPHLEMGRELVRRFNGSFKKPVFPEFEALLTPVPKLLGTDNRKMSKSYGNTIGLTEDPDTIRKKVKAMITDVNRPRREDPGHPEVCNVFTFHKLLTPAARVAEIEGECRSARLSCGDDKSALADRIIAWSEPFRARRRELERDMGYVEEQLKLGTERARVIAVQTMDEVFDTMDFWPPRRRKPGASPIADPRQALP